MALPFSTFIEKDGFIFTSGQVHLGPDGTLVGETIEEQVAQVMNNLRAVLDQAGVGFENVVKSTVYITNMADYSQVSQVYATYFKNQYPAREIIGVKALPLGASVEISLIAKK
ncbi:MAG: hypothetical protein A2383_02365 [Candidatus Pacebacteria bacterium RIFOXYB1_FULL_39_46]|nr:MAG: hypothetical protein A2383_02365 [Candidatus Pacebacteria bacterium RIFOXYB1_FULL_39_46]OGJ39091.1 MAG: hypothetical protein A2182_02085 [Candidatus Pacebacteria bacterium RIFOXYA1_FULL_38_18]OGJ40209.1 MAG: hypothetical protein A2582_03920 [Candidatus Pacebacteria bacterium RIFOXYD1_FULL_39_27]OGJ41092.1 MAG: hypothetical protein A2411_01265 [Candidatus Pacebacteria bacterium RIFOXYC1_FULL_39_21]